MFNEQFQSHPKKNLNQFLSSCVYYVENRNQIQINVKRKHEENLNDLGSSSSATSPAKRSKGGWLVKLATESPARTDLDTDVEDGYSTVHDIETGKVWNLNFNYIFVEQCVK